MFVIEAFAPPPPAPSSRMYWAETRWVWDIKEAQQFETEAMAAAILATLKKSGQARENATIEVYPDENLYEQESFRDD